MVNNKLLFICKKHNNYLANTVIFTQYNIFLMYYVFFYSWYKQCKRFFEFFFYLSCKYNFPSYFIYLFLPYLKIFIDNTEQMMNIFTRFTSNI